MLSKPLRAGEGDHRSNPAGYPEHRHAIERSFLDYSVRRRNELNRRTFARESTVLFLRTVLFRGSEPDHFEWKND